MFPPEMLLDVERFLSQDYLRPPGLDVYQDCFDSSWFFPLQRREELQRMIQIARTINPQTVMEIGADKGAGVYHWVKCLPTVKRMIACEIRGTPYSDVFEKAFPEVKFLWLRGSSRDEKNMEMVRNDLTVWRPWVIDVLFIDGDKKAFLADFEAYLPLMNPNGVVFMHDINEPGPMRGAFETVKSRGYRTEEIIDTSESVAEAAWVDADNPPHGSYGGWLNDWRGKGAGVGVIYLEGVKR